MNEVTLFGTCLAEAFFPDAVEAAARLLARLKLRVRRMTGAFCCGQIAFNDGLRDEARELARRFIANCEPGTPVVIPSGSCTSMVKVFYRDLFAGEPEMLTRAARLQPAVFELSQFLVNVLRTKYVGARFEHRVAFHPSCHLLRELHVADEPRLLLSGVQGLEVCEFGHPEECCGFGGMFSVKFPHISVAMLRDKMENLKASGAQFVVSNDCGCLMHIGGGLHRAGLPIGVRHLAQVLAST